MLFNSDKSCCKPTALTVVSRENKNSHIVKNNSGCLVYQYHIDGDIIIASQDKRCDYIVEVVRTNNYRPIAFIIELKGSDVNKAVDQIKKTIERYKNDLKKYDIKPRIILHKARTQEINSSKLRDLKRKYPYTDKGCIRYEDEV